ncbi:hypothetical protein [Flavobacterium sp. HNIBRBA15423]|uniref:hypothetical protein n=1 Tax=Flavobacterium sp. HNIBRBA15423 TaxID=3458683 RepID=UPI004043DB87
MSDDKYYIISVDYTYGGIDPMMLGSMPDLPEDNEDDWMFGQPFTVAPEEPIFVAIREDNENLTPLNFYKDPPVATKAFIDALVEAGVNNIVTYDVLLRSRTNPSITIDGYKAINIIGWVKAAGPGTVYLTDSRIADASMKNVELEPRSIKGLYMFRLAQSMRTIVVHEKVKQHLEAKGFEDLIFTEPGDALIL